MKIPAEYISRLNDGEDHLEVISDLIHNTTMQDPEEICGESANGWGIELDGRGWAVPMTQEVVDGVVEIDARIHYFETRQAPGGCADRIDSEESILRFIFRHKLGDRDLAITEKDDVTSIDGN